MTGSESARPTVIRRALGSRSTWLGGACVVVYVMTALCAPLLAPYDPERLVGGSFASPSWAHWLGTDQLGRDLLSRVVYGARLSLLAGVVSVTVAVVVGATAGAMAGYFGGRVDAAIMRLIDVLLAFPGVLVALLVVTALRPGWGPVMLAVGLINVPVFCRQVRSTVLVVQKLDYVVAAQAAGAGSGYVLRHVVLPTLVAPVVVLATLGLGTAILEVAGLSFLGIAGELTQPEWGSMLNEAKNNLRSWGWRALAPGAAISLAVIGFNLLGDGLRDALDPQLTRVR